MYKYCFRQHFFYVRRTYQVAIDVSILSSRLTKTVVVKNQVTDIPLLHNITSVTMQGVCMIMICLIPPKNSTILRAYHVGSL
jgi:hypothetical protein